MLHHVGSILANTSEVLETAYGSNQNSFQIYSVVLQTQVTVWGILILCSILDSGCSPIEEKY